MKRFKSSPIKGVISICLLALCLVVSKVDVQAKNLGRVGPVYPIIEKAVTPDQDSPDHRPQPLYPMSLPAALAETQQFLDLTYTVPWDITDAKGNIVYPKGYRYNPLVHHRFRTMIVIDGSDPEQIDWALNLEETSDPMTRVVITQGNPKDVSQQFDRRVYRLHPKLAQRFGIKKVPTIVQQKGEILAVTSKPVH